MRVNTSLEDHVKKNIGGTIVFNNGCWIDLTEEDGMFWGITPYGETWGCSAADNVVESIVNCRCSMSKYSCSSMVFETLRRF